MRRVAAEFTGKDSDLNGKLIRLQEAALDAFAEVDRVVVRTKRVITADATIRPGEVVLVPGGLTVNLQLVTPQRNDELRELVVIKALGTGTVFLRPVKANINSASVAAITALGKQDILVAEGQYWY